MSHQLLRFVPYVLAGAVSVPLASPSKVDMNRVAKREKREMIQIKSQTQTPPTLLSFKFQAQPQKIFS